jgi:phosphoglycolate phosphatase-like HAD superfamily hydrolase
VRCNPRPADFSFAVFDCDGVILDSNPIKTAAFRHALEQYPTSKVEQLVDYHRTHGGVSRYEKFRHFFVSLVAEPDETTYETALERFQSYCWAQLREAPLVPGVVSYLEGLRDRGTPMFVVSGSDETELKAVLGHKRLLPFFDRVLGSPTSKRDNLRALLETKPQSGKGIFFGDAQLDYEIAAEHGLDFVYVHGYSEWEGGEEFCAQRRILCVADFRQLTEAVEKSDGQVSKRRARNGVP